MKPLKTNHHLAAIPPAILTKYLDLTTNPDVISLSVGEPDFATPYHIREAAIEAITQGKTFYTPSKGFLSLRKEISAIMERKYDLSYDPATEVLVTIGASEAIEVALITLLNEGDEVIVVSPSYISYEPIITMFGGKIVNIETHESEGFRLTPVALKAKLSDKTRLVILNYPNNPSGAIMNRTDLEALADVLRDADVHIVSDEIYSELTYHGTHVSLASLPGMREKTLVINGFSKAYAMTGWRLGYVCAPKEIIDALTKYHQYAVLCAPTISQFAGIEALKNGDEDIVHMREEYDMRRRFVVKRLNDMGLSTANPLGAFYVFVNVKSTGMGSVAFCDALLESKKVALIPGTAFGISGEGYARLSYSYSIHHIQEALSRIEVFLKELKTI
ncbi:MAG: pyridoxal phosphate-dependent aminotransferase [Trichloromonadaceae bacterium]